MEEDKNFICKIYFSIIGEFMKIFIYIFLSLIVLFTYYLINFLKKLKMDLKINRDIRYELNKIHTIQFISLIISVIGGIVQSNLYGNEIHDLKMDIVDFILVFLAIVLFIFCLLITIKYQKKINIEYNIELDYFSSKIYHWLYIPIIFPVSFYSIKYNLLVRFYNNELSILFLSMLLLFGLFSISFFLVFYIKGKENKILKLFSLIFFLLSLIIDIFL